MLRDQPNNELQPRIQKDSERGWKGRAICPPKKSREQTNEKENRRKRPKKKEIYEGNRKYVARPDAGKMPNTHFPPLPPSPRQKQRQWSLRTRAMCVFSVIQIA